MVNREATNDLWSNGRGCLFVCLLSYHLLIPQFGKSLVSVTVDILESMESSDQQSLFFPKLILQLKKFFSLIFFPPHFGKTKIHNSFWCSKSRVREFPWRSNQDSELSLPRASSSIPGLGTKIPQTMQCNQKKRKARIRQNTFCSKSFHSVE